MLGEQAGDPRQSGGLDFLMRSQTRLAETLTLLRTLPTLCSTLVATSAMPAWREATSSCLCTRSSSSSASRRSVMSSTTARAPSDSPAGPDQTLRARQHGAASRDPVGR